MTILPKGTILNGPDGQAYELVDDYHPYDLSYPPAKFKAIGGAPEPRTGEVMPGWLAHAMREAFKKARTEAGE